MIETRCECLVIEEWVRVIDSHSYKFNVTKWPLDNKAVFSVWQESSKGRWLQIHLWRWNNGKLTGTYTRR